MAWMALWGATFLASTSLVQAQFNVYHPFPDSNAVWGMTSGCMDGQCGDAALIQNRYAGDTLIDGFLYKRIHEIYAMTSNNGCCYPPEDLGSGFLREDTIAKKVYWRGGSIVQDSLLYDFDMQLGDTLKGYMGSCGMTWTVGSIDSILIGINYRKRINFQIFDPCTRFAIVEGIGSMMGLTTCPYIPFEFGITLQCFTTSDSLLYSAPCGPDLEACGDLTSAIHPGTALVFAPLKLLPNPASDRLVLQSDASHLPLDVCVVDLIGGVHMRKVLNVANCAIDISTLSSGIYFLHIQRNGILVATEKFIKQ